MQNQILRSVPRKWDFLEPAMNPDEARTDHIVLTDAASDTFVSYPVGQIVKQKNDGTNEFAKVGTSGFGGPARIIKYPVLVNDEGQHQKTDELTWDTGRDVFEGSVAAYYKGFFKTQDLVGAGGTNEVQTLTLDADVDGGTFTITFDGYTTAPIAWNATAANIEAAIVAAAPTVSASDITSSGSAGGPHTFTFVGNYAGRNVPLMVLDITGLTDGGVAVTADATAMVETTAGAGLLTGVGRLVRGTNSAGIMELGAATPA